MTMIEEIVVVATITGPLGSTFVGPLCLLFGFIGLIGLVVALMMRSALIYVAAALAPIVWSTNVLPLFRGSARKLVHLTVALVVSKLIMRPPSQLRSVKYTVCTTSGRRSSTRPPERPISAPSDRVAGARLPELSAAAAP
jgi:hypothetical protein